MKTLLILITLFLSFTISAQSTSTIVVNISYFESNEGKVYVALYDSADTFLSKHKKGEVSEISDLKSTVTFEGVENGTYAISVFHDENGNGKLDTGMFGIPSEPVGTSNNASGFFGPPEFDDAKFKATGEKIELDINL